jgi:hypothetical protein
MSVCRILAKERGLTLDEVLEIDKVHLDIAAITADCLLGKLTEEVACEMLTQSDYELQSLWGFPKDASYHVYARRLKFKLAWVGRTFKCVDTGTLVTLRSVDVYERSLVSVGHGAIDLGRFEAYHRVIGNVVEVFQEEA